MPAATRARSNLATRPWLAVLPAILLATTALTSVSSVQAADEPSEFTRPPQVKDACDPADGPGPGYCGDGGLADAARLAAPRDVAVLPGGDLLIADGQNFVIRRVEAGTNIISTAAGIGILGFAPPDEPTNVAEVALADPRGVAALADGSFAIADAGLRAVLVVAPNGLVRTLARFRLPVDVVALSATTLAVVDAQAGRVIKVHMRTGRKRVLPGRRLERPWQAAPDAAGGLIVSQARPGRKSGNVLRLKANGRRSVVAGPGARGRAGKLRLARIAGVAVRADGTILVADHDIVRAVSPTGAVAVVAGGDDFPQNRNIYLGQGEGLAESGSELLIADSGKNQVHRVPADPAAAVQEIGIHPVKPAGAGVRGYSALGTRTTWARRNQDAGAAPPCKPVAAMPPSWKVRNVRGGKLVVYFGGKGTIQITLRKAGTREVPIFTKRYPRRETDRRLRVDPDGRRGSWFARLRWNGSGCRQTGPFRL